MEKYVNIEKFKRELIDKRNFYPAIVKNALEHMPTEDVVEIIRCKDCKYSSFASHCSKYECERIKDVLFFSNDFCSYGKRKE